MTTLGNSKMSSLKDKIEEKAILQEKLTEVDDKIDEIVGDKKVKIKKTSLKGTKNPKKG